MFNLKTSIDCEKMYWKDILMNVGKPIWDNIFKKWRILTGYQYEEGKYYVTFSDTPHWELFKDKKLYLEEI